jgi:CheY-like chemotaxis protein
LRDHGYDVVDAGVPSDINEVVAQERPDAVVIDCAAFDVSESLFDTLRGDERHAALPVVLISDTPELALESLRARRAQHVRLVPKPFSGSQVARALQELLAPIEKQG